MSSNVSGLLAYTQEKKTRHYVRAAEALAAGEKPAWLYLHVPHSGFRSLSVDLRKAEASVQ